MCLCIYRIVHNRGTPPCHTNLSMLQVRIHPKGDQCFQSLRQLLLRRLALCFLFRLPKSIPSYSSTPSLYDWLSPITLAVSSPFSLFPRLLVLSRNSFSPVFLYVAHVGLATRCCKRWLSAVATDFLPTELLLVDLTTSVPPVRFSLLLFLGPGHIVTIC